MSDEFPKEQETTGEGPRPRPSQALHHRHAANKLLLSLDKSELVKNIAHRGNHLQELKLCARDLNNTVRNHYADFIHNVGRNIYPLIIATEESCGESGTTLTLYEANGNITTVSPTFCTSYQLYKTCAHMFMGLSVELGPYLANAQWLKNRREEDSCKRISSETRDMPWKKGLSEILQHIRLYRQALVNAESIENEGKRTNNPETLSGLPQEEMTQIMMTMMCSVINYCETCLETGLLDLSAWEQLNNDNFPRIKACMKAATKCQADSCVKQIVHWKNMLGEEAWRDLYVVIPTVWAVGKENPRKEMFRQLMDPERVHSHIITSEYPRDHSEARTLLGRVVGDRAIGRLVFGLDSVESQIKVMGLSSKVDVVQDDAIPAIWSACEKQGCPVRCPLKKIG